MNNGIVNIIENTNRHDNEPVAHRSASPVTGASNTSLDGPGLISRRSMRMSAGEPASQFSDSYRKIIDQMAQHQQSALEVNNKKNAAGGKAHVAVPQSKSVAATDTRSTDAFETVSAMKRSRSIEEMPRAEEAERREKTQGQNQADRRPMAAVRRSFLPEAAPLKDPQPEAQMDKSPPTSSERLVQNRATRQPVKLPERHSASWPPITEKKAGKAANTPNTTDANPERGHLHAPEENIFLENMRRDFMKSLAYKVPLLLEATNFKYNFKMDATETLYDNLHYMHQAYDLFKEAMEKNDEIISRMTLALIRRYCITLSGMFDDIRQKTEELTIYGNWQDFPDNFLLPEYFSIP